MPTRAELPRPGLGYEEQPSWTDDLPVCKQSGVGLSTNQIYRRDGHRREEHPFEDASFHLQVDNEDTYLYGVFDGHNGVQTATFALQSLASEILLDSKLAKKTSDDEIREFLRQAFIAVEKSYLESIDDRLAERTSLMYEIPEGMKLYEAYKSHPHVVEKLNTLNYELSCGTTAVVAFVTNGQLFVANVGDSRALLCKNDENGVLRVIQLSVDHDLSNEDELLRLYNLGLQIDGSKGCRLGNQKNTRCLGNYLVKGAYKEFEELAAASSEPITAEPEIHGGIKLDNSCRFLLLMSDGLYKSLEEATGIDHDQVNKEIVQMVVQEFRVQSTLTGVAQAVVDKVVRIHHDMYMGGEGRGQGSRDDITLLVRNFNFPLPNALSPSTPTVRFPATQVDAPLPTGNDVIKTQSDTSCDETTETFSTDDTSSSGETRLNAQKKPDERIKPYVDFTEYYRNIELARLEGTLPPGIEF